MVCPALAVPKCHDMIPHAFRRVFSALFYAITLFKMPWKSR